VILACRSKEKAASALSSLQATSPIGTLSSLHLDQDSESSILDAAKEVESTHGYLDILINNAAIGNSSPNVRDRFVKSFHTNVLGPRLVSEHFRPLLLKAEKPRSIYVSSGAGSLERAPEIRGMPQPPNGDAYMVSKAALNMVGVLDWLQNEEAIEKGEKGVKVYVMSPGFVVSNLRGTSEELRTGWGKAGDPMTSGKCLLNIAEGKRDGDMGKLICREGTYPW
jgi:NAD(P)-dependent dehydrogenase (short-subunit alcohol dehydrogenase family)